ncbi:growth hormone-inducible transmembrane protein [Caerostris extrusa]|uniref:Growth hormone-inducible transmembrane protein n=1 Tax=Caerostris extrusa TaxID=172846 RepID=A0AAV4MSN4_CAEEX|nr:growth hormone-inducible transmembrane protein [Caerostris extrusa]
MTIQTKGLAQNSRSALRGRISTRNPTLKERLMAPEQGTAFNLGKAVLLGGSAFGIGCLCFYGLGFSSEPGAFEKSIIWPEFVKDRIRSTYAYFGGSIAITAASAYAVSQSPKLINLMMRNSWLAIGATLAAVMGSAILVRSIPYSEAAWYTAGIVLGLSSVAICAPSERFLNWGGPLACGLGVVFASSLGSMFLPPTTALGAGLYSISVYGGLVLFGGFLLYHTQHIVRKAETHPVYGYKPYDPINASISIYSDTLNIFIRIAMLLAGGGGSRRK